MSLGEEDLSVLMKILVENIGEGNKKHSMDVKRQTVQGNFTLSAWWEMCFTSNASYLNQLMPDITWFSMFLDTCTLIYSESCVSWRSEDAGICTLPSLEKVEHIEQKVEVKGPGTLVTATNGGLTENSINILFNFEITEVWGLWVLFQNTVSVDVEKGVFFLPISPSNNKNKLFSSAVIPGEHYALMSLIQRKILYMKERVIKIFQVIVKETIIFNSVNL